MDKDMIGLAGEMRVASELLKRGYQAYITFGNAKATDIVVTGDSNRFIRIQVKTSINRKNFVTGYYPKYTDPNSIGPDIWVFYLTHKDVSSGEDRFFILTHEEVGDLQFRVNKGKKTERGKGCDNIPLKFLEQEKSKHEGLWEKISKSLNKL